MLVWLDMANSPHPMLLGPVADELERAGHEVWVTARDHAQTLDLTLARWADATIIGGASPNSRSEKVMALSGRLRRLAAESEKRAPTVAMSLNSYAQVAAARLNGVRCVTLMDYEFQPANHLSFRLATRVVVPEAFPEERLRRFGARSSRRVRRFAGYKEEFYLDMIEPAASDAWAAVPGADTCVRCLFRPPPEGAMYHGFDNAHFDDLLRQVAELRDTAVLLLSRFPPQRAKYAAIAGVTVADDTVAGISTLRDSDVFIGAGGTMCREAALLGTPAYTVFVGRMAAVDECLLADGRLRDLRSGTIDEIDFVRRTRHYVGAPQIRARAIGLRQWLVEVIEDTGRGRCQ